MTEHNITIRGIATHYKVFGQGKPMLILHGWGSDLQKWHKVADLLAQKNLCIVIPDLPGFGESQKPPKAWNLEDYVAWTQDFCQSVPELKENFYLLGHSFGGAVAAKFTIRYNQRVVKLFLCAAAAIRKKTVKKQVLGRISSLVKVFSFLPFYSLAKKAFYKFVVGGNDYLRADGVMKETFLKAIEDDVSQKLLFIKVPVVIVWGDKDDTTLVEDAYWINQKIPHSTLIIIPGANHAPYIHIPEILSQKIIENL